MYVGVPRETKVHEYRVALTPPAVAALVRGGHRVAVETRAGAGAGYDDDDYRRAGAEVVPDAQAVFAAELVVKVKEPQPPEVSLLRRGQVLFCYLHLAAAPALTRSLQERGVTAIALETVRGTDGGTPLLAPMSVIAGRLSVLAGSRALEVPDGGRGVLLSGVPGVPPARVVVVGAGVVGSNAARAAVGLGAEVIVLDRDVARLADLEGRTSGLARTAFAEPETLAALVREADMVVGAAYLPGHRAPRLLSRETVASMRPGAALVDVSIDQGGISETSRPTTHGEPTYLAEGVVHYCVANIPALVARTATLALSHALLPYVARIAERGWETAMAEDAGLAEGLNLHQGVIRHPGVSAAQAEHGAAQGAGSGGAPTPP